LAFLIPAMEARLNQLKSAGKQAAAEGSQASSSFEMRAQRMFAKKNVGTLIISPTRELASQIAVEASRLATYHDEFEVRLFVGGVSKGSQLRDWYRGRRDIVVATPGRLRDFLQNESGFADAFQNVQILVLDEADTLLDMGFREDIEDINRYLPNQSERQTFLFSATVSSAIHQIAKKTMDRNHTFINTVGEETSPVHAHVAQYHTILPSASHQIPHILRLLAHDQLTNLGKSKVIVFLPTTKMTMLYTTILRSLKGNCLPAGRSTEVYEIHSKKTQESRTRTSDNFRKDVSGASVLVTSDVSARGVDYPNVTRVIQVGIPQSVDQYVHRVGRTGRRDLAGRGDLVLLPWESGFVTWKLTEIPIKPLSTETLTRDLEELASKIDQNGLPAVERPLNSPKFDPRNRERNRIAYASIRTPVSPTLVNIEGNVTAFLEEMDPEAVDQTFVSLLGYYFGKTSELRCEKEVILDGCKDLTTEGFGLPAPPHVSQALLEKIGFSSGSRRRGQFGNQSGNRSFGMRSSGDGRSGGAPRFGTRRDGRSSEFGSSMTRRPRSFDSDSDSDFMPRSRSRPRSFDSDSDSMPRFERSSSSDGNRGRSGNFSRQNSFRRY